MTIPLLLHTLLPALPVVGLFILLLWFSCSSLPRLPIAPPCESSYIWGHEYRIFKADVVQEYLKWALEIAPVYRIKAALFQRDIIVVSDPLAVHHIFQNAYQYKKPAAFMPLVVKYTGRGLVWADDDEHKRLRKLVAHAFTPGATMNMSGDILQCAEKCAERLAADISRQKPGATVNLSLYIPAYTLQAIARVGFGRDFGPDSPESIAINESWRNDVEIMSTFTGFITPIVLNLFPWITKLPIPALQEDGVTKKIIHRIGHRMLEDGDIKTEGRDIFSLLVKDWSLTNDRLLDNIVTFMFAGFETSSSVISFTILSLAQDLETQEKLREHLTGVNTSDYSSIDKLPYLDAVVREGLRMHPSAHDTERISIRDDVIPLQSPITMTNGSTVTSFPVKAGERFIVPWTVLNVSPAIWGSDAARFRPERWLEPNGIPSSGLPRGPFSNIATFADGPRSCIGWRLAVMQIKIILAVLIKSFEFKDTGVHIGSRLVPSLQPTVDGKPGNLPLHVYPVLSQ